MSQLPLDEESFRDDVRAFVDEHFPPAMREKARRGRGFEREEIMAWHKVLGEKGWLAPAWPVEYGGTDWPVHWQFILEDELANAGCPPAISFNVKMLGPILIANGTAAQKAHYLPRILRCDDWWCQGYSEPGSGSDLASLRTSAIRDGDDYVVNGSKIWTSTAHLANKMFCLVRTDPDTKPQEGISFILIDDIRVPEVTIRPIRFINGRHHFNEVFFDNLRVPVTNRVGGENRGWTVAKSLLSHERLGGARSSELRRVLARARAVASEETSGGGRLIDEDWFARRLWALEVDLLALEQTMLRFLAEVAAGRPLGAETSLLKARGITAQQSVRDLLVDAVGYYGLPFEEDVFEIENEDAYLGPEYAVALAAERYTTRGSSIAGGSHEVQSMITAKRVLGL